MIRIPLNFDTPPITKNKVRRMHHMAEAKWHTADPERRTQIEAEVNALQAGDQT